MSTVLAITSAGIAATTASADSCNIPDDFFGKPYAPQGPAGKKQASVKRSKEVKLTPSRPAEIVNYDGDRGVKEIDVVLTATPALPTDFQAANFEIYVPQRFQRIDENGESLLFERPTFSRPRFHENRTRVSFTVCLDAADAAAGSYGGEMVVAAPRGFSRTAIAVTANLKNEAAFRVWLIVALVAAFFLLLYATTQNDPARRSLRQAVDFGWIVEAAVSLVAGAIAAIVIYSQNPAWGSDPVEAGIGLAGAVFAAAGVQSLVRTVRSGDGGNSQSGQTNAGAGTQRSPSAH